MVRRKRWRQVLVIGAAAVAAALAQTPRALAHAQEPPGVLEIGQMAPDFEVIGSTRWGVLDAPVRLSDFRGNTVVLAFFYRVRTPG
jgi:thioredoxin-dependent peroxiredoxin